MAKTGVVKKPFPYSTDGTGVENLTEGRVLSFPDRIFDGLKDGGYVAESGKAPENSVFEAVARDVASDDVDQRLSVASDADLKAIIARSGEPVSGNLVHAVLVASAKAQLQREAAGKAAVLGVDPASGVTEHPLAAPGAPTPPSAPAVVAAAQAPAETRADAVAEADGGDAGRASARARK